jgi:glycosyltransferase involved in cell wall biosynthesis
MKRRRLRICFVAEQFFPPVLGGSELVYKAWLDTLSQRHDVYAIFFNQYSVDTREANDYLPQVCRDHLILPGQPDGRVWRALRVLVRSFSGGLFAPRIIEEHSRAIVKKRILAFLQSNQIDLFVFSKLSTVHLFGYAAIARLARPCFLDLHDDYIENERVLREVTKRLLRNYPSLYHYRPYVRIFMRHHLSRFSINGARRQERRMLGLFDCILSSSVEEWSAYRERLGDAIRCEFLAWPIGVPDSPPAASNTPEFHAGFIGSSMIFNTEGIVYFCTRILPLVLREIPYFRCLIAGKVSDPLSLMGQSWPGVSMEPHVADVGSFYARIGASIVPVLSGTGVSLKTVEAIAHGKPVVATSAGVRGLQRELYPDVLMADDPALFARKLINLSRSDVPPNSRIPCSMVAADFLDNFDRILQPHYPPAGGVSEQ